MGVTQPLQHLSSISVKHHIGNYKIQYLVAQFYLFLVFAKNVKVSLWPINYVSLIKGNVVFLPIK